MQLCQIFAVSGNDLLVPVEGVLLLAAQVAGAIVKLVDIDETVTLSHLAGGSGHQIDAAPRGVAHQVYAVLDGLGHLLNVLAQVVDTVAVVNLAVLGLHIVRSQTILHHHKRDLIAGIVCTAGPLDRSASPSRKL